MNVNASSNFWCVPSQMNLHSRMSTSGRKTVSYSVRTSELMPSHATTRSYWWRYSSADWKVVSNWRFTPSSRARSCSSSSMRMRPMPAKPWPPETVRTPRWMTAMSSQYAKWSRIAAVLFGSLCSMLPSASADSTTPQPNVSSARLRSSTVTSCDGSRSFIEIAKYNPAGPPPRHRTLMPGSVRLRDDYFKLEIIAPARAWRREGTLSSPLRSTPVATAH